MNKTVCAVLLAAGSSTRMGRGADGEAVNKLLLNICGKTPIERCAEAFEPFADEFVFAVSKATEPTVRSVASRLGKPCRIVYGGERRQDSALNALAAATAELVAVHDCARCLVSKDVIREAVDSAALYGSGVAAVPVRDTLRKADSAEAVDRSGLIAMQTPQCFDRKMLIEAYCGFNEDVTDDAAVWLHKYGGVRFTKGDIMNQKLTEQTDIEFFKRAAQRADGIIPRIGLGEDTHRLVEGRRLILGGVDIPFELGLLGHSDADVLVHAVMDAILGACALGDIGRHFPDSSEEFKGISSLELLKRTIAVAAEHGFAVTNIDAVITAQKPKLAPHIDEMRKNIADAISYIGIEDIGIKATTPEGLGPEGRLEGITARAAASVIRRSF